MTGPRFNSRSGHSDLGFLWFSEIPPGECWDWSQTKAMADSIPTLPQSLFPPMRVIEVNMDRHWNEGVGETGDPREDPPTNGIVRHDSHLRQSIYEINNICLADSRSFAQRRRPNAARSAPAERLARSPPTKANRAQFPAVGRRVFLGDNALPPTLSHQVKPSDTTHGDISKGEVEVKRPRLYYSGPNRRHQAFSSHERGWPPITDIDGFAFYKSNFSAEENSRFILNWTLMPDWGETDYDDSPPEPPVDIIRKQPLRARCRECWRSVVTKEGRGREGGQSKLHETSGVVGNNKMKEGGSELGRMAA
ncbi:hypothetical protein PR048_005137 [Dryococelus australis]|uniref:Uncharacterized protein n=1 Tax=Dryococelus australis TaxID=614101 RepID=A0ABQ9I7E2_9NEOP|nr:hypothetical protein PR048_005137 [Dryococelus australis]